MVGIHETYRGTSTEILPKYQEGNKSSWESLELILTRIVKEIHVWGKELWIKIAVLLGRDILGPDASAGQLTYNPPTSVNHHARAGKNTELTFLAHGNHTHLLARPSLWKKTKHSLNEQMNGDSSTSGSSTIVPWAVVISESERPTARGEIYSLGRSMTLWLTWCEVGEYSALTPSLMSYKKV